MIYFNFRDARNGEYRYLSVCVVVDLAFLVSEGDVMTENVNFGGNSGLKLDCLRPQTLPMHGYTLPA
jgi:hypothetical protein